MKIKELLVKGNEILKSEDISEYILKSRMLLANLLKQSKEYLIIHEEDDVEQDVVDSFFDGIQKLKNGVPIQYIIKKQEFMGLDFFVNENVLIPRPDTEVLVEEILEKINAEAKILDLCTGSGAIGISIAKITENKNTKVVLADISVKALEVAKQNCLKNDVNLKIINSDLFDKIEGKFDIIVSNPPYIETSVIDGLSAEVKNEPHLALDGGEDGLEFYRKISKYAKNYLENNGLLVLEIGYNQKDQVIKILKDDGYVEIYSKKDYSGLDRIIICKRGE